jgi:hypothetical protein
MTHNRHTDVSKRVGSAYGIRTRDLRLESAKSPVRSYFILSPMVPVGQSINLEMTWLVSFCIVP